MSERPYIPMDPQYAPGRWELTRRSSHTTDAHRSYIHGRIEPMEYESLWSFIWRLLR